MNFNLDERIYECLAEWPIGDRGDGSEREAGEEAIKQLLRDFAKFVRPYKAGVGGVADEVDDWQKGYVLGRDEAIDDMEAKIKEVLGE